MKPNWRKIQDESYIQNFADKSPTDQQIEIADLRSRSDNVYVSFLIGLVGALFGTTVTFGISITDNDEPSRWSSCAYLMLAIGTIVGLFALIWIKRASARQEARVRLLEAVAENPDCFKDDAHRRKAESTRQLNTSVDEALYSRLDRLARRTGRSRSHYAAEFIERGLDDLEDHYLLKDALEEFHASDEDSGPHEDVDWDSLGR